MLIFLHCASHQISHPIYLFSYLLTYLLTYLSQADNDHDHDQVHTNIMWCSLDESNMQCQKSFANEDAIDQMLTSSLSQRRHTSIVPSLVRDIWLCMLLTCTMFRMQLVNRNPYTSHKLHYPLDHSVVHCTCACCYRRSQNTETTARLLQLTRGRSCGNNCDRQKWCKNFILREYPQMSTCSVNSLLIS